MAGLYIHIPFCKQACTYCNFHFSTSLKLKNEYLEALLAEADMRRQYLGADAEIETIYFGGGTPSLLSAEELKRVLEAIGACGRPAANPEITLEANPDDITAEALQQWKNAGINRLSIGIQSFRDQDLQAMNRTHSAAEARNALQLARDAGFHNFSIDLIYGIPGLSDADWKRNVEEALSWGIHHLSCYVLTVEPRTALDSMIRKGRYPAVQPDDQARQFEWLMAWMEDAGYEHYEISNFARPGHRSRHNSSYWQGIPYLGLGASAHSYNGQSRQWNLSNNSLYIRSVLSGVVPFEKEDLEPKQQYNEYLMIALRMAEGIDLERVKQQFGEGRMNKLLAEADRFIGQELVSASDQRLFLTRKGKLFADGIAAALFE